MIMAITGLWMALFPLLLISSAADAGNPYGVPPMHPQSQQWQRPATQWDANGGQQWMAPNWAQPPNNGMWQWPQQPSQQQQQQQQYGQYPPYRVPMAAPDSATAAASSQGCYASPWCPPPMTTVAAAESTTTWTTSATTIVGNGPVTAIISQTPIAVTTTTTTTTTTSTTETIETSSLPTPSPSSSSSSYSTQTTPTTSIEMTSPSPSTSTSTTTETTTTTSTTTFFPTTTANAPCNLTTPANATVVYLEGASVGHDDANYAYNGALYLGGCPCPLASGLVKQFFSSQVGNTTNFPQAVRFNCGCDACPSNVHNYTDFCVCAESGECFQQQNTITLIEIKAVCTDAGECHSYIQLYGRGGSLVGDRGTVFLASQQTGPFGPNSPYIKAVSATCFGGCTQLKQAVLC